MKKPGSKQKISFGSRKQALSYLALGFVCSTAVYYVGLPVFHEFQSSFAMKEFKKYGIAGTYKKHFFSFADHLTEIMELDHENVRLSQQVAKLEHEIETEKSEAVEGEAKTETLAAAKELKETAGSELARTVDSIPYAPPTGILPHQLYVLGVSYFRKAQYEQSAVIFSQLVNLKEDISYQKAENYILGGISWYQLKQYHLAHDFFKDAKAKSTPTDSAYRSVIVWEALMAKAEKNRSVVEQKIEQLMAQYPHSEELRLMKREPASREGGHERAYPAKIENPEDHTENQTEKPSPAIGHSEVNEHTSAKPAAEADGAGDDSEESELSVQAPAHASSAQHLANKSGDESGEHSHE